MSKKADLLKNTLILAFGKFASQLVALILLPLYTAFLSPADYGFYDLAMTYITLLAPVLTIQMEMAVFRHLIDVRKSRSGQTKVLSNVMQLVLIAIIVIAFGAIILGQFVSIEHLPQIGVLLIVVAMYNIALQVARGIGRNKVYAAASIIAASVTLLSAIVFVAVLHMGVVGIFYSMMVANLAATLYVVVSCRLWRLVQRGQSDRAIKKSLMGYALPLIPNSLALWVVQASDRTIIALMIDVAANGIYAIASKFPLALSSVFSVFNMSWTEAVSLHISSKDKDRDIFLSDAFNAGMKMVASLGLVMVAAMHFVFPIMINPEFNEALRYIPILALGVIASAAMSMFGAVYVAKKMTKKVATTSLIVAVLNVILTTTLIPHFGLYGASAAMVISYVSMVVIRHFDLKKYINLTYDVRSYATLFIAYAGIIGVYYLDNMLVSMVGILFASSVVLIVNKREIMPVMNKIKGRMKR